MLAQILSLITVTDVYCNATNATICYFTACSIDDEIDIQYDGSSSKPLQISLFISDTCNSNNVNVTGNFFMQTSAALTISGGFSTITKDLTNFRVALTMRVNGHGLKEASIFALSISNNVILSDISITGDFTQEDGDQSVLFGGLAAKAVASTFIGHVEICGLQATFTQAENAGFLLGLVNHTFSLTLFQIIVGQAQPEISNYPHFALDVIELLPNEFYCETSNLDFELRMRHYMHELTAYGIRESKIISNDAIAVGLIGRIEKVAVKVMEIGVYVTIEKDYQMYDAGLLAGIIFNSDFVQVSKSCFESPSIVVTSNAGVVGLLDSVVMADFKLTSTFTAVCLSYSGIIASSRDGNVRISAAVDLFMQGERTGGVFGGLHGTDATVNELIGHVEISQEGSYNGLIVGEWGMSDEHGSVNNLACFVPDGCTLNTLDVALLNEQCGDYAHDSRKQ